MIKFSTAFPIIFLRFEVYGIQVQGDDVSIENKNVSKDDMDHEPLTTGDPSISVDVTNVVSDSSTGLATDDKVESEVIQMDSMATVIEHCNVVGYSDAGALVEKAQASFDAHTSSTNTQGMSGNRGITPTELRKILTKHMGESHFLQDDRHYVMLFADLLGIRFSALKTKNFANGNSNSSVNEPVIRPLPSGWTWGDPSTQPASDWTVSSVSSKSEHHSVGEDSKKAQSIAETMSESAGCWLGKNKEIKHLNLGVGVEECPDYQYYKSMELDEYNDITAILPEYVRSLQLKESKYQQSVSFEFRKKESTEYRTNHPSMIPVICQKRKQVGNDIPELEDILYLLPNDCTVAHIHDKVRDRLLSSSVECPRFSIFNHDDDVVQSEYVITDIDNKHRDEDGYLYLFFDRQNIYRELFSFEERRKESSVIRKKYPGEIPIIFQKRQGAADSVPNLEQKQYRISKDLFIDDFLELIRQKISLPDQMRLSIFNEQCQNALLYGASMIENVDKWYGDPDGYLYFFYDAEHVTVNTLFVTQTGGVLRTGDTGILTFQIEDSKVKCYRLQAEVDVLEHLLKMAYMRAGMFWYLVQMTNAKIHEGADMKKIMQIVIVMKERIPHFTDIKDFMRVLDAEMNQGSQGPSDGGESHYRNFLRMNQMRMKEVEINQGRLIGGQGAPQYTDKQDLRRRRCSYFDKQEAKQFEKKSKEFAFAMKELAEKFDVKELVKKVQQTFKGRHVQQFTTEILKSFHEHDVQKSVLEVELGKKFPEVVLSEPAKDLLIFNQGILMSELHKTGEPPDVEKIPFKGEKFQGVPPVLSKENAEDFFAGVKYFNGMYVKFDFTGSRYYETETETTSSEKVDGQQTGIIRGQAGNKYRVEVFSEQSSSCIKVIVLVPKEDFCFSKAI